ncbi:EfeM/EfeO family lipoprotein [Streptomyces griseocarneus]|nr:EfeM/EfeO family lipoprotein [Streptomyces griseocarneus]
MPGPEGVPPVPPGRARSFSTDRLRTALFRADRLRASPFRAARFGASLFRTSAPLSPELGEPSSPETGASPPLASRASPPPEPGAVAVTETEEGRRPKAVAGPKPGCGRARRTVVRFVLAAGGVFALAAPTGAAPVRLGPPPSAVEVSPGVCGRPWPLPRTGLQTFVLHNAAAAPTDIHLVDARTGAVLGEVEGIAPGAHRRLTAGLGPGTYAFVCLPEDGDPVLGPAVRVPATARDATVGQSGGPAALPVTREELTPPTLDYQRWVAARIDRLVTATDILRAAVDSGDRAAARAAWLPAHLDYARLGAAYDAFGDAGRAIDGDTAGLPGGVTDPGFTGFHRVEHGLWHGERGPALRAAAHRLASDVHALRERWSRTRMDPADLGRRAHEILEDTLQHELTGRTDHGSGSGLATARAHLDGTRAVLGRLRPLLQGRYPDLPALDRRLGHAGRLLDRFGPVEGDGDWTPLDRLTPADRRRVDAAIGDLAERLASVATLCEPRRTP